MRIVKIFRRMEATCFLWKPVVLPTFTKGLLDRVSYRQCNLLSRSHVGSRYYRIQVFCSNSSSTSSKDEILDQRFLQLLKQNATRKAYDLVLSHVSSGEQLEESFRRKFIKKLSSAGRADLGYELYRAFFSTSESCDPTLLLSIWKTVDRQQHSPLVERIIEELEGWLNSSLKEESPSASEEDGKYSVGVQVCVQLCSYYIQQGNVARSLSYVYRLQSMKPWVNTSTVNKLLSIYSKAKCLQGLYATIEMKKRCNIASDSDTNTLLAGAFVKEIHFVTGAVSMETLPKPLPEVAFVGKSNVGKSSLLNLLVNNYSIAYTSKTPGKTQQLNYFIVNRSQEDKKFFLVDLPGYGYARVSKEMRDKWVDLIRDYLEHRKCLKVLFHLIDASQGLSQEDRYFIEFLLTSNVLDRYHAVLTKMDKCTKSKDVIVKSIQSELVALGFPFEVVIIPTSVKQRWGSEDLWLALKPLLLDKKSSSRPSA
ncbi:hypothetical protein GAYE_PCTG33G0891 [Galdieria yellowstonensis]|uniref:EngB-type G domain-containing protein n=1 Tax=Galdieria yellowstonensis TaxID=3028027 RepID=A0AAV9I3K4_9RHOD|nr:hypothetical protein GAYE_PCTG33G0891 [Galdieria yellowstonensis]